MAKDELYKYPSKIQAQKWQRLDPNCAGVVTPLDIAKYLNLRARHQILFSVINAAAEEVTQHWFGDNGNIDIVNLRARNYKDNDREKGHTNYFNRADRDRDPLNPEFILKQVVDKLPRELAGPLTEPHIDINPAKRLKPGWFMQAVYFVGRVLGSSCDFRDDDFVTVKQKQEQEVRQRQKASQYAAQEHAWQRIQDLEPEERLKLAQREAEEDERKRLGDAGYHK